jgi:hypothetical protein
MTMSGGTGLGVRAPEPGCTDMSSSSNGGRSGTGGPTSKLTEEEEEGLERGMERRALGGTDVAGTGRRTVKVGLEASVEEE